MKIINRLVKPVICSTVLNQIRPNHALEKMTQCNQSTGKYFNIVNPNKILSKA